jgi:hypothetical protein
MDPGAGAAGAGAAGGLVAAGGAVDGWEVRVVVTLPEAGGAP